MTAAWILVLCHFVPILLCTAKEKQCVAKYYNEHQMLPPRHYQYFHEAKSTNKLGNNNDNAVSLRWRIVGGKEISISDVPYQVMYGKYCGGSLIAPEWVITAAHCRTDETHVYAGSSYRSQTVPYKICEHFLHPNWHDFDKQHYHDYDYQLVLLQEPIPINHLARPIAIGSEDDIRPGTLVSVSGWGHLEVGTRMTENLRRVFVPIIPLDICMSVPNVNYHTISSRMFCAGFEEGKKDACQGDSGGPAVVGDKLLGLVSFGVGCAMRNSPGVYSNIPMARDWIREVTKLPL